jgi:hypothetical protein
VREQDVHGAGAEVACDRAPGCRARGARCAGETNLKIKNCFPRTVGKHLADDFRDFAENSLIRCAAKRQ